MRQGIGVLLGVLVLAGCGGEDDGRRDPAQDRRDVAMVERLNQVPFKAIRPEPFTPDDIDRYDLARAGCMFRPGTNADVPPLFVAQQDRGYLKIEGKLHPLAVKSNSAELPSGAHATYIGLENWVELVAQAGDGGEERPGGRSWPSRLVIHDADERVAFDSLGQVTCAAASAAQG